MIMLVHTMSLHVWLIIFFFQTNSATGLDNIAEYRTKAQTLQHIQSIQQCLTETEKKHICNLYGITEVDNSLIKLDLDLHRYVWF